MHAVRGLSGILIASAVMCSAARVEAQESGPVTSIADGPRVAKIVISSDVQDRQPVDDLREVSAELGRVFCWTDIRGAGGESLEHVWIHDGVTRARVPITVGSNRWRCYSSKRLLRSWTGPWQVKVSTADGRVLSTVEFMVH